MTRLALVLALVGAAVLVVALILNFGPLYTVGGIFIGSGWTLWHVHGYMRA